MSEKLAKKVGLRLLLGGKFEVAMTSREKLISLGKCTNVQIYLQGVPNIVDFFWIINEFIREKEKKDKENRVQQGEEPPG